MSKTNGQSGTKPKKEKLDMWWESDDLESLREMSKITSKPMAEIVRAAVKRYLAKERPRLDKLAKLHAQLLP